MSPVLPEESHWSGACTPVEAESPVTMLRDARVRPQCLVRHDDGDLSMLYSSFSPKDAVSINTCLATSSDSGHTWRDDPNNPVLDRIEADWQGKRAFATGLTWDEENQRWVMATVGNDTSDSTPGKRAIGLWFSDDLVEWEHYSENPIITIETDNARNNTDVFPAEREDPVGMYLRDFHEIDGGWNALVQWRGESWSRMLIMESTNGLTGPWEIRNLCLDPTEASAWFKTNRTFNWCQPTHVDGRWYAVCQNGVGDGDEENDRVGIVYSDDYFTWEEVDDNPVTAPLRRPNGSKIVPSQQQLLSPTADHGWRILLGARGNCGDRYAYIVSSEG